MTRWPCSPRFTELTKSLRGSKLAAQKQDLAGQVRQAAARGDSRRPSGLCHLYWNLTRETARKLASEAVGGDLKTDSLPFIDHSVFVQQRIPHYCLFFHGRMYFVCLVTILSFYQQNVLCNCSFPRGKKNAMSSVHRSFPWSGKGALPFFLFPGKKDTLSIIS